MFIESLKKLDLDGLGIGRDEAYLVKVLLDLLEWLASRTDTKVDDLVLEALKPKVIEACEQAEIDTVDVLKIVGKMNG